MTPSALLQAVRQRQGLTQAQLAARAGTTQPVVSAYEHGRRDPTFATLAKLVAAGGEELRIDAVAPAGDLPKARDAQEHARRFLDVLSIVDAMPSFRRDRALRAPRMVSW